MTLLLENYWKPYFWSRSYMVLSTGGATVEIIKNILKNKANQKNKERVTNPHQIRDLEGECVTHLVQLTCP
nr:transposase [Bacillus sp. EB01]